MDESSAARYDAWYRTSRGAWIGDTEYRLLHRLLQPRPAERVLDVGCGTAYFTRRFAKEARVQMIGLDPNVQWLSYARDQSDDAELYVAGRAEQLPLRDESMDRTLCVTSLCFVADQITAVREMVRVTRTRLVLGLLNRNSLLYLWKGRRGGVGGYRGAHWHTPREIRCLFEGLPVRLVELRSAVYLPDGGTMAQVVECALSNRWLVGGFLAVGANIER